jgi:hypothetical protein
MGGIMKHFENMIRIRTKSGDIIDFKFMCNLAVTPDIETLWIRIKTEYLSPAREWIKLNNMLIEFNSIESIELVRYTEIENNKEEWEK